MSINEIHFMREILVTDSRGKVVPTMQASYSNASCVNPIFKDVAFYDHAEVSKLYHELGGGRHEGALLGATVVIPNRSRWANLWRISAAEVQVISSPVSEELSEQVKSSRQQKTRARNSLMRD